MPVKLSSSTAVDKALQLYELLLFSNRRYNARDLAERLQCSKSTISRLISQVEARCPDNFCREIREGREWYYLDHKGSPRAVCSREDLQRLRALVGNPQNYLSKEDNLRAQSAIDRLEVLYGYTTDMPVEALQPVAKSWIDYTAKQGIIAELLAAIHERRVVRVHYQRGSQPEREWLMAPARLLSSSDAIYLEGWFVRESQGRVEAASPERTLKVYVQRLTRVERTELTHDLRLPDDGNHMFGIMSDDEPFDARIRFLPAVVDYVRERNFSDPQRMEMLQDGSLLLTIRTRSAAEVVSFVLGYGCMAELMEPEYLRERVRGELERTLARYTAGDGGGGNTGQPGTR